MIRKTLCILALANLSCAFAQDGTSSPYSYYGIGEGNFKGVNEIRHMGSLAVYTDSLHMNTLNPASYSKLDRATFSLGASYKSNNYSTTSNSSKNQTGSFDYLAINIPAGKFGIGVGIAPESFSGYKISNQTNSQNMTIENTYSGNGGLNNAFLGLGYSITKNLSVGAQANYIFGTVTNNTTKYIVNNGDNLALNTGAQQVISNKYSGLDYQFAVNYIQPIDNKNSLHFNGIFSPETKLTNDNTSNFNFITLSESGNTSTQNISSVTSKKDMITPMKYSAGIGYGNSMKWFIGAEYTLTNNEAYNKYLTYDSAYYQDAQKISIGGFYTPKYNSFTNYLDIVTYRAGFKYENTGLVINNENINDISGSIGFGLPVGRFASSLNIGFEYGQKGSTNNNLVKQDYFSVSVGFSFNDRWFEKRKFE